MRNLPPKYLPEIKKISHQLDADDLSGIGKIPPSNIDVKDTKNDVKYRPVNFYNPKFSSMMITSASVRFIFL
jgi:hypothetical protein